MKFNAKKLLNRTIFSFVLFIVLGIVFLVKVGIETMIGMYMEYYIIHSLGGCVFELLLFLSCFEEEEK